ncbi:MAG TPA: ABC transporter, partial [Ruminiclostridium sp.]|nr:ABC transporter [Ruminiclostridium sp.]
MSEQKERTRNSGPMGGPPGMGISVEKAKDFKETWGKLICYCKSYMPVIVISLVIAALGTLLQIIGPDRLKEMTNEIMKGLPAMVNGQPVLGAVDFNAVFSIGMLLVFFYASSAIFNFVQSYMMATVTAKISKSMRTGISQKINKLPLKYF